MSEIKPKSRRGRKPKIKIEQHEKNTGDTNIEPILKKKRGRKKKCEMNLGQVPKISGYNPNGESIDTEDNKVKFGDSTNDNRHDECESVSFGILKIKRVNVVKKSSIQHKENSPSENSNCMINLDWIIENTKKYENKLQETQKIIQQPTNLSNFFDVKPQEKLLNYTKTTKTKHETAKSMVNKKKNMIHGRETRYIKILQSIKGKENSIPTKSDVWCWWCCHPFEGIPRFMPTGYDQIHHRFKVTGIFCSWSCVKAFYYNEPKYSNGSKGLLLTTLIKTIHGRHHDIPTAPPRATLKCFGGTMTIDEFRNIDKNIYYEINTNRITMDESYYLREVRR